MVTVVQSSNKWGNIGQAAVEGAVKGYEKTSDQKALKKAIEDLGPNASGEDIVKAITRVNVYDPESKKQMIEGYIGAEKVKAEQTKAEAQKAKYAKKEENAIVRDSLIQDGMPEYLADMYINSPPSVQNRMKAEHDDLKSRGYRVPLSEQKPQANPNQPGQPLPDNEMAPVMTGTETPLPVEEAEAPVAEEIEGAIKKAQAPLLKPKVQEWPKIEPPKGITPKEAESWRSKNQNFNNKELKDINNKVQALEKSEVRYGILNNVNDSKKIPTGIGKLIINPSTGEPYEAASLSGVVNKETQQFVKTVNDFMINAKEYFGARVTNFDVQAFKSRLPTLMNTEEGRRIIIKQMQLMDELQLAYDSEMKGALQHYGRDASYSDILQVVDERAKQKQEQIIGQINNLNEASDYMDLMANNPKYKDYKLFQKLDGKFKAVPLKDADKARNKEWIEW